jgi:hypothetical protein
VSRSRPRQASAPPPLWSRCVEAHQTRFRGLTRETAVQYEAALLRPS